MLSSNPNSVAEKHSVYIHRPGTSQERRLMLDTELKHEARDLFHLGKAVYTQDPRFFKILDIVPPLMGDDRSHLAIELFQDASKCTDSSSAKYAEAAAILARKVKYALDFQAELNKEMKGLQPENDLIHAIIKDFVITKENEYQLNKKINSPELKKSDVSSLLRELGAIQKRLKVLAIQLRFEFVRGPKDKRIADAASRKTQWIANLNADLHEEHGHISESIHNKVAEIKADILKLLEAEHIFRLQLKITRQADSPAAYIDRKLVIINEAYRQKEFELKVMVTECLLKAAHQKLLIANKNVAKLESKLKHLVPPRHKAMARILNQEIHPITHKKQEALNKEEKHNQDNSKIEKLKHFSSQRHPSVGIASAYARRKIQLRIKMKEYAPSRLFSHSSRFPSGENKPATTNVMTPETSVASPKTGL